MANTVIQIKNSGVSGNVPGILQPGELAINYADGKLYYGNELSAVTLFDVITEPTGLDGEIQFNDSGTFGSDANLSFDKTTGSLSTENIQVGNKISVSENVHLGNLVVNTTIFTALATTQSTPLPNAVAILSGNSSQYVQMSLNNIDPDGSSDYVVTADVGTDETFYVDMGIQNSGQQVGVFYPLDGYLYAQGNTGQLGGNLVVGTGTTGQTTKIIAGGTEEVNVVAEFGEDLLEISTEISSPTTTRIYNHSNSAYDQANTATTNAATADQKAVSAGSYANSAYGQANAAFNKANSATTLAQSAYDKANTPSTNSFSTIIVDGSSNIVATSPTSNLTFFGQTGIAIATDVANSIIAIGTNLVGASNVIVDYGTVTQIGVITFDYGHLT